VTYSGSDREYDVTVVGGATIVTPRRSSLLWLEGTDTLYGIENIRFSGATTNHAPQAWAGHEWGVSRSTGVNLAFLVPSQDADADTVLAYEVRDLTSGVGYFTINGIAQPANQTFSVLRADWSNVVFHTGMGVDSVQVRAWDGVDWGNWSTFTVTPQNTVPVVTANAITAPHGAWSLAGSSLFSAADADADAIVRYEFRDNSVGNGYFQVGGTA